MSEYKITPAGKRMLRNIRDHDDPFWGVRGRHAHGGATQTYYALVRAGYLENYKLTDKAHRIIGDIT